MSDRGVGGEGGDLFHIQIKAFEMIIRAQQISLSACGAERPQGGVAVSRKQRDTSSLLSVLTEWDRSENVLKALYV